MMNGLVVKRGESYLAWKGAKSARPDAGGIFWSKEVQAARVFKTHDAACRAARKFGGVVRLIENSGWCDEDFHDSLLAMLKEQEAVEPKEIVMKEVQADE